MADHSHLLGDDKDVDNPSEMDTSEELDETAPDGYGAQEGTRGHFMTAFASEDLAQTEALDRLAAGFTNLAATANHIALELEAQDRLLQELDDKTDENDLHAQSAMNAGLNVLQESLISLAIGAMILWKWYWAAPNMTVTG